MHSEAHASAGVLWPLLILAMLAGPYAVAALRQRRWSGWRTAGWMAGAALAALAFAQQIVALAHHDLRAHMVQHLLLGMFAPLGLALGAPITLALRTLPAPTARQIVGLLASQPLRLLSHPVSALGLNSGGMYLLYLTPLYELSLRSPALQLALHAHFLAAGSLFTWAIIGLDPAPHRPPWPVRLAVLFASIAAHATLGKMLYAFGLPRSAHGIEEIRAAAQLMYYGGDLAELLLAIALFGQWYRARGRQLAPTLPNAKGKARAVDL